MNKLTPELIMNWQIEHGEDFLIDGPMTQTQWIAFDGNMLQRLKADTRINYLIDMTKSDVEYALLSEDTSDALYDVPGFEEIIYKHLCDAAYETNVAEDILRSMDE